MINSRAQLAQKAYTPLRDDIFWIAWLRSSTIFQIWHNFDINTTPTLKKSEGKSITYNLYISLLRL